jgi:hypothetical protein
MGTRPSVRRKTKFLSRINLICPVESPLQKYSPSPFTQITSISPPSRPPEGRWPSSLTRGGMRWTRQRRARNVIAGRDEPRERENGVRTTDAFRVRQSRVVLAPVAGVKFAEARRPDRAQTCHNPLMTVTTRTRSPGRARNKPLKPLRAGMPGDPGEPSVTTLVCFVLFCTRGCGCIGHPAFPTPSFGRMFSCTTRALAPRECGVLPRRHCEERSDEAIHSFVLALWIASLRSQ